MAKPKCLSSPCHQALNVRHKLLLVTASNISYTIAAPGAPSPYAGPAPFYGATANHYPAMPAPYPQPSTAYMPPQYSAAAPDYSAPPQGYPPATAGYTPAGYSSYPGPPPISYEPPAAPYAPASAPLPVAPGYDSAYGPSAAQYSSSPIPPPAAPAGNSVIPGPSYQPDNKIDYLRTLSQAQLGEYLSQHPQDASIVAEIMQENAAKHREQ